MEKATSMLKRYPLSFSDDVVPKKELAANRPLPPVPYSQKSGAAASHLSYSHNKRIANAAPVKKGQ